MRHIFRSTCQIVLPSMFTLIFFSVFLTEIACAKDQGHGRVNMQGSIIDTACAIDVNSRDQTINMASLPVGQIIRDGFGPEKPFSIHLINCTLKPSHPVPGLHEWSKFQVTFDGMTTRDSLFGVSGEAKGVGLQITGSQGEIAIPGEPMSFSALTDGDMHLDYTLRLMANHETVQAGNYKTAIRFKLDYF